MLVSAVTKTEVMYYWLGAGVSFTILVGAVAALMRWLKCQIAEPLLTITGVPSRGGREAIEPLPLTVRKQGEMIEVHGVQLTQLVSVQSQIAEVVEAIANQVTPNGGATDQLGDRVQRIEAGMADLLPCHPPRRAKPTKADP